MKQKQLIYRLLLLLLIFGVFTSCKKDDDIIPEEATGVIRNEEDAHLIAIDLNDILEEIRDNMSYGNTYTSYSPEEGTYTMNGGASSGPIFTGSYTKKYVKNFTVNFNNHKHNNTVIKSGSIKYNYTDYSTSGYHLIIKVNSISNISLTCMNKDYKIDDRITNLNMGDTDDNRYMIWAGFSSSNGKSYSVKAY